ncbi:hypothetical protein [Candidatus Frankia nodulisporulans]|uniref:hypothetical protein n=1 Tax=Candidatus Frankia nodulisporulans TaxID=2060052 RepID=UPI0013D37FBC|nr:hypothetical protein [Candidatus Frankia nodulisporulans]
MSADQAADVAEASRLAHEALGGVPFAWNPDGVGRVQSAALASIALSLSVLAARSVPTDGQATR